MGLIRLRTKITSILLLITIVTASLMSLTTYYIAIKIMNAQGGELGLESAKYNAERVEVWGKEKVASLERTGIHIANLSRVNNEEIEQMLLAAAEADSSFFSVFIALDDGRFIDGKGWRPGETYDARQRPWFTAAKEAEKAVFTPVYIDTNMNTMVTSIAIPIKVKEISGVLAGNIPIDKILNQVKEIKYGKTGYGVLVDQMGRIISHPRPEYILQPIEQIFSSGYKDIIHKVESGKNGVETVLLQGEKYLLVYAPVPSYGWELLLFAPQSEFQGPARTLLMYLLVIFAILLLFMIPLGYKLGMRVSKPIEEMIEGILKLAEGDLTQEIHIKTRDELNALSIALNKMRKNLSEMLQQIKNESDLLHQHSRKLTQSIEEISDGMLDFISVLSHDIRTPLTLIKGYARGIQLGIVRDPDKMKEYVDGIVLRAEQIENISADILDCAYEIKKSLILKKEYFVLQELAFLLYDCAKQQVESSERVFEGQIFIEGGMIHIDEIKIVRVWNNVISNAIKYSETYSKITVFIRQSEKYLICSMKDEGIGIEKEEMDKIFDMFYRGKEIDIKGYGLGLAISKVIMEAHGGKIIVESEPGEGSTFTLYLPICH
ncbi:HAMP domain-containing histidine kinase [Geosporobacter ferrireducens]|uniref:histidine kinase n=1 Tax=Geosporobacter ferrireducens TaxID=1424294 RepID=A0A1D8GMC5_9FIRM|nr:HAMP domain-containing histidine kinase [Geosporobacter ferrireducens]AOT72045.1 hypothetical protein Gferi_22405 [Geosporobacter ferrireducens]MTI55927.1 HAMP domain-containing histidine kinase [Geosporobacter ferrireducens]